MQSITHLPTDGAMRSVRPRPGRAARAAGDAAHRGDGGCGVLAAERLNRLPDADDLVGLTLRINGGRNGLDDRRRQRGADLAGGLHNLFSFCSYISRFGLTMARLVSGQ